MISVLQLSVLILGTIGTCLAHRLFVASYKEDDEKAKLWAQLNVVGLASDGVLPWTRALLLSLTSMQKNAHRGYEKVIKGKGLPFALPTIWMQGAVVVLPPSLLHLLNKPEGEVKAFDAQLETIQLPYMIPDPEVYRNVIHFDVVRKHMVNVKHVESLAAATAEEIDVTFREVWGTSDQWITVNGWDYCGRIITRAATRILIGLPMCRNEDLFEQARLFSDSVMLGTAMLNCLPPVVRPLIGPLMALKARYHRIRCLKLLVPFVKERMRLHTNGRDGEEVPNDFVQWMILQCAKEGPEQMNPVRLATRLLALNTMFVIAMAYVFSHCVVDIYSSPSKAEYVNGLRAECSTISAEYGGLSTREAVNRLFRTDSALRESMRFSDVAVTALARDVVGSHLDLGNGIHVPRGVRIVYPTQPIHQDSRYYDDPLHFDAFRFSRPFGGANHTVEKKRSSERQFMTTITDSFLAFGYGKHQCPGRWFAAQTLKQALAALVMNYDVEVVKKPTSRQALLNMMVPATDVKLRIRRRC